MDEFNKALDHLENLEVKIDDEDNALMLLNSLPKSYEYLKDAMIYCIESSLSLEEVTSTLRVKYLQKANSSKNTI